MNRTISRADLASLAHEERLRVVGVTTAEPFYEIEEFLVQHIEAGHMAGLDWFMPDRARQSCDPHVLHPKAKSIVSVAVPFWSGPATAPDDGVLRGRIARYAWGADYHRTLRRRMRGLVSRLEFALGHSIDARTLVDTARIVDRAAAARAGTGWYGKNSMIIVPGHGSWVMLGEIILDIELVPDLPVNRNCGRCSICIDRCPTGAIVAPYTIDTPRCISFLTIEERGPIPMHLRSSLGNWVFGCDICQDVCPYTVATQVVDDDEFKPRSLDNAFPSLEWLLTTAEAEFRAIYSGTAVTRAKRRGMARNAAVALGNSAVSAAEPILLRGMTHHDEPLVRGHAAWALARLVGPESRGPLVRARHQERDAYVREEIDAALAA